MNKKNLVDYIFWIVFIFFSNPGGIIQAIFKTDSGDGSANVTDFLFLVLFTCYFSIFYIKSKFQDESYLKFEKYLFIFGLYYLIVFIYLTPIFRENQASSFISTMIKSRHALSNMFLFVVVYKFFLRSYKIFFEVLIYSSIVVISLFLFSYITGYEILKVETFARGFINMDRVFMLNYGLMFYLIPMGAVVIVFKINFKWKRIILISFGLMFLTWLLSLTRRHIFGSVLYLIIAITMFNYFQHKSLVAPKKILNVLFYAFILLFIISLSFPKYVSAGKTIMQETINVIQHGETATGTKDTRLGFGKKFMTDLIIKNPVFGTGFDNNWRTKVGDEKGYEATDYPFIGALAMIGFLGILVFLPMYIVIFKALRFDIKFLRSCNVDYNTREFFILMFFILLFFYDFIQYMNWFSPISISSSYIWFVSSAMYLASRQLFYKKYFIENQKV